LPHKNASRITLIFGSTEVFLGLGEHIYNVEEVDFFFLKIIPSPIDFWCGSSGNPYQVTQINLNLSQQFFWAHLSFTS
jgi:hypothetical protein